MAKSARNRSRSKKSQTQGQTQSSAEQAATATEGQKKPRVSNEDFVLAYLDCTSYVELAEKLGSTDTAVANRANRLRKMGVNLPRYVRRNGSGPIDVEALNELIEENATE